MWTGGPPSSASGGGAGGGGGGMPPPPGSGAVGVGGTVGARGGGGAAPPPPEASDSLLPPDSLFPPASASAAPLPPSGAHSAASSSAYASAPSSPPEASAEALLASGRIVRVTIAVSGAVVDPGDPSEEEEVDGLDDGVPSSTPTSSSDPTTAHAEPRRGRSASLGSSADLGPEGGGDACGGNLPDASSDVPAAAPGALEASLLLGIAGGAVGGAGGAGGGGGSSSAASSVIAEDKQPPRRSESIDPSVLPASMTAFLDALTEEQRRVRHRHVPSAEGFRRLYRGEVRTDLSEARRRAGRGGSGGKRGSADDDEEGAGSGGEAATDAEGGEDDDGARGGGEGGGDRMEVEGREKVDEAVEEEEEEEEESPFPDRDAFLAPSAEARSSADGGRLPSLVESASFENGAPTPNGGPAPSGVPSSAPSPSSSSPSPLRPPLLVDALTSFDPPRPRESTAAKTRHRLRRWEARPDEAAADLESYRRTVARTREELRNARVEREKVERTASLVRDQLGMHLTCVKEEEAALERGYKEETGRMGMGGGGAGGGGGGARGGWRESIGGLEFPTGGVGVVVHGPRSAGSEGGDWRSAGVGGVGFRAAENKKEEGEDGKPIAEETATSALASGWILVGDSVVVRATGEGGRVVHVRGPDGRSSAPPKKKKPSSSSKSKKKGGDSSSSSAEADAGKRGANDSSKDGVEGDAEAERDDDRLAVEVGVKVLKTGHVKTYSPSELDLDATKNPSLRDLAPAALAGRWREMIATSLAGGADRDSIAMEEYVTAGLREKERRAKAMEEEEEDEEGKEEEEEEEKEAGGDAKEGEGGGKSEAGAGAAAGGAAADSGGRASPKSVSAPIAEEEEGGRRPLPYGSGLFAAPALVRDRPHLVGMDRLERVVRAVTCDGDARGPRVVPCTPSPSEVRRLEARREEIHALRGKAAQLRNRLGRQKRLRASNERALAAGRGRSHRVEGLLLEMQMDLRNLKERLQDELNELGIGNSPARSPSPESGAAESEDPKEEDRAKGSDASKEEMAAADEEVSMVEEASTDGKEEEGSPPAEKPADLKLGGEGSGSGAGEVAAKSNEDVGAGLKPEPKGGDETGEAERESKRPRVEE